MKVLPHPYHITPAPSVGPMSMNSRTRLGFILQVIKGGAYKMISSLLHTTFKQNVQTQTCLSPYLMVLHMVKELHYLNNSSFSWDGKLLEEDFNTILHSISGLIPLLKTLLEACNKDIMSAVQMVLCL